MNEREMEIGALNAAIAQCHSNLPTIYRERALAYLATNQHAKAINDYTILIQINPKYAGYHFDRGVVWQKSDIDKAIADYTTAIQLNPKLSAAFVNRGLCWKSKGDLVKAEADFAEAFRLDPNSAHK